MKAHYTPRQAEGSFVFVCFTGLHIKKLDFELMTVSVLRRHIRRNMRICTPVMLLTLMRVILFKYRYHKIGKSTLRHQHFELNCKFEVPS